MIAKIILMFITVIMLPGCGFKLQGMHKIPEHMKEIVISSDNNESPFIAQLNSQFQNNGITLFNKHASLNNSSASFFILEISVPEITEQVHGYNSRGQISYGRIFVKIKYTLFDKKYSVVKQNTITRSRIYEMDPNQLLSNANQKNIILDELNVEIINELILQLTS